MIPGYVLWKADFEPVVSGTAKEVDGARRALIQLTAPHLHRCQFRNLYNAPTEKNVPAIINSSVTAVFLQKERLLKSFSDSFLKFALSSMYCVSSASVTVSSRIVSSCAISSSSCGHNGISDSLLSFGYSLSA